MDMSAFMSARGIRDPVIDDMTNATVSLRRSRYARNWRSTPGRGSSATNSVEHLPANSGVATLFRYGRSFRVEQVTLVEAKRRALPVADAGAGIEVQDARIGADVLNAQQRKRRRNRVVRPQPSAIHVA